MDPNYRVLALDPGGTTGWASFSATKVGPAEFENIQYSCGQIGPYEHHKKLYEFILSQLADHTIIVCEDFLWRNNEVDKVETISLHYIGVVKLLFNLKKGQSNLELYMQSSAEGKIKKASFVKKNNLYRLGVYQASKIHAMDAYGHLFYWIINKGGTEFAEVRRGLLEKAWKE